jgi:low affinity Fe/Cu permease
MDELFRKFAHKTSAATGSPWAFILAVLVIVVWLVTGPVFNYSDTWQLAINTGTTIVTFLMVFLIQNTQNRDAKAMHLKLDELIRSIDTARNSLVDLENSPDEALKTVEEEFRELRDEAEDVVEAVDNLRQQKAPEGKSTNSQTDPACTGGIMSAAPHSPMRIRAAVK